MIPARAHVALYRRFLQLFPRGHIERHGREQVELFGDLIATGHRPLRLWASAILDLIGVIRRVPGSNAISHLARLALYPLSTLNAAAGVTLAALATLSGAVPGWVTLPAGAVAVQGIYTLAWLRHRLPVRRRLGDLLFVTGEATALAVGSLGLIAALISQSGTGDPEYGPPTILTLVAVHGLVGLVAPPPTSVRSAST